MILTIAKIIVIWTLASIPLALIVAAFMGTHKRTGEGETREFSDAIELGGAADFLSIHDDGVDRG